MLNKDTFIRSWYIWVLLLCLFIVRIPSFYLSSFPTKLLTSHTLAKVCVPLLTGILLIQNHALLPSLYKKYKSLLILVLLYFASQSISITSSTDVVLFWKTFHNILISITSFIAVLFFIGKRKNMIIFEQLFIIIGVVLTLIALIYYLFPYEVLNIINPFVQEEYLNSILVNLSRHRNTLELSQEIFLAFFLFKLLERKTEHHLSYICFALIITYLSIASNYRTYFVMCVFTWLVFFASIHQTIGKRALLVIAGIAFFFFSVIVSGFFSPLVMIDRFSLSDELNSMGSIKYRLDSTKKSIDLFFSSPVTGIGLGNYVLYQKLNRGTMINQSSEYSNAVLYSPHNVIFQTLAETGLFGFLTYTLLILFFIRKDISRIIRASHKIPYIIAFWSIFIFFLLNPANFITQLIWFWSLRGYIETSSV
jgi:O-antigen ligase